MGDQQDILVMGDNHGDVESLEQVIADTQGEQFDFIIHVGDLTNAWFDGIETGVIAHVLAPVHLGILDFHRASHSSGRSRLLRTPTSHWTHRMYRSRYSV